MQEEAIPLWDRPLVRDIAKLLAGLIVLLVLVLMVLRPLIRGVPTPADIGVDSFQADRSPTRAYRTAPLKGLWTHQKGGFYHDGRFATREVVVERDENCLPMIPSGKPHNEMILPDFDDDIGSVIDAKGREMV